MEFQLQLQRDSDFLKLKLEDQNKRVQQKLKAKEQLDQSGLSGINDSFVSSGLQHQNTEQENLDMAVMLSDLQDKVKILEKIIKENDFTIEQKADQLENALSQIEYRAQNEKLMKEKIKLLEANIKDMTLKNDKLQLENRELKDEVQMLSGI